MPIASLQSPRPRFEVTLDTLFGKSWATRCTTSSTVIYVQHVSRENDPDTLASSTAEIPSCPSSSSISLLGGWSPKFQNSKFSPLSLLTRTASPADQLIINAKNKNDVTAEMHFLFFNVGPPPAPPGRGFRGTLPARYRHCVAFPCLQTITTLQSAER